MRDIKITRDIALKVILFGACRFPKIGSYASEYNQSDLLWAEDILTSSQPV